MSHPPARNGHAPRPPRIETPPAPELGPARSGRRFVMVAVVAILALWGALFLAFRDWRARHRALAEFGERAVASAVDPAADRVPPGVDPRAWRRAVADTHAMLGLVAASGMLDRSDLELLARDLRRRVAGLTPETARAELSALWDEMRLKAGPATTARSSRPPFPPERPKLLGGTGG